MSPEMFPEAINIMIEHEFAIAVDDNGNDIAVLAWIKTTYVHAYEYSGGVDLWFLDQYDGIILRGCNEFSVELCLGALRLWQGTQIIFVGSDWGYLIDQIPEIAGKNCIWEDELSKETKAELTKNHRFLDVFTGIPHEEEMTRFYNGEMTYDEVMAFTYMFSNKKCLGEKHPDKRFCLIDGNYANLGLFTLLDKSISFARYVKKKGFIPVMRMKNPGAQLNIYQDSDGDEIWPKFFNQPESYSLEEVLDSSDVTFPPTLYNARIMQSIMDDYSHGTELSWPNGIYNESIRSYIREREQRFLPSPSKTLGVLARGTDFVNTKLSNHSIHASKEMLCKKIDNVLTDWGLEYIYLATEDASYCTFFKKHYGDRLFFTDQERFTVNNGELLAEMHRNNPSKREGFLLGAEYITSVYLLSKCNSLIASGNCSGTGEALKQNNGQYKHTYIFNLGKNM